MKKNDIVTPKEGKYCGKNGVIRNTVKMYIATSFEHCEKYDVKFENGEVIFFSENELTLVKEGKFDAIQVKVINKSRHNLPEYATDYSAGMDIKADTDEPVVIKPLERAFFSTGLYIALPIGYEAQLRPRSGLACKHGITLANSPSTIDADYRGEIKICLINLSNEPFTVEPGERICQMVVAKHEVVEWNLVEELDKTERGEGGFGSTGRK